MRLVKVLLFVRPVRYKKHSVRDNFLVVMCVKALKNLTRSQTLDGDGAHVLHSTFNLAVTVNNWVWVVLVGVFRLMLEALIFLAVDHHLHPTFETRVL